MKPKRIALTGGIATGKSTVARMLVERGALILDADKFAREAVRPGSSSWQALQALLGLGFFEPSGELKRRELRNAIIQDKSLRTRVESILHPAIIRAMEEAWEQSLRSDPRRPVVFDIPLLYEGGLEKNFDTVLLVYASPEVQIQRLMARDNLTRLEAETTLTMQLPITSKRERADLVIDNSQNIESTQRQVEELWNSPLFGSAAGEQS